jgi:hypothetical protein
MTGHGGFSAACLGQHLPTPHLRGRRSAPIGVNLNSAGLRKARVAGVILWPTAAAVGEGASKISP